MASGTRALGSVREPLEWQRATSEAREARAVVAGQLADLLVAADATGGWDLLSARVRELGEARRSGDIVLVRAAVMSLGLASAQLAVRLDLQQDHPGSYR
jgi:hypothetical protein